MAGSIVVGSWPSATVVFLGVLNQALKDVFLRLNTLSVGKENLMMSLKPFLSCEALVAQ